MSAPEYPVLRDEFASGLPFRRGPRDNSPSAVVAGQQFAFDGNCTVSAHLDDRIVASVDVAQWPAFPTWKQPIQSGNVCVRRTCPLRHVEPVDVPVEMQKQSREFLIQASGPVVRHQNAAARFDAGLSDRSYCAGAAAARVFAPTAGAAAPLAIVERVSVKKRRPTLTTRRWTRCVSLPKSVAAGMRSQLPWMYTTGHRNVVSTPEYLRRAMRTDVAGHGDDVELIYSCALSLRTQATLLWMSEIASIRTGQFYRQRSGLRGAQLQFHQRAEAHSFHNELSQ